MATKRLTISLPEEVYDEVGALARREHRSVSEFVREAIRKYSAASLSEERDLYPWEAKLIEERMARYHADPDDVHGWEDVESAAQEGIRAARERS